MNKINQRLLFGVVIVGIFYGCGTKRPTITDIDGNIYHTVVIGNQTWMIENLKTTKYNDGTVIPLVSDSAAWANLTTPEYCWYKNDSAVYKNTYGGLYNWYAVNTGRLAPTGWHVPTDDEWSTLITYLGGEIVAGGKLKEVETTHWNSPNTGATNETGFSALPGGCCDCYGACGDIGLAGGWWSATAFDDTMLWTRAMTNNYETVARVIMYKNFGFSVRCVQDSALL